MFYIRFLVFAQAEQAMNEEEIALIAYVVFVVLFLSIIVILFFVTFQKRKSKIRLDQINQQKAFDKEISRSQTEIQEQTLKHIGWELHDNVGQLLAYANMQLNVLSTKVSEDMKSKVEETTQTVKQSLTEVRSLSRSLNSEVLLNRGLEASIKNEIGRLKRMKFSSAELEIIGEQSDLNNKKHEIIIFRIIQEFFSNSVKYSQADDIKVVLEYQTSRLLITVTDNGDGFDVASVEKGSGLINMKSRAALIAATFNLESKVGEGVKLTISYPFS